MNALPSSASSSTSALSAFLRGIERRAYVLVLSQCGNPDLARSLLGQAMRSFRAVAAATPLSAWPASFWSVLLAVPALAGSQTAADGGVPELRALTHGPRVALLLRLVAGLDFAHASRVLGITEAAYRYANQRALQQLGDAGLSYRGLSDLRERLHRQVKALPAADAQALAMLRERVLADQPEPVIAPVMPPNWPRRLGWAALAALGLAFLATFVWPLDGRSSSALLSAGGLQELPMESAQPSFEVGDADAVTHPDYDLLQQPDEQGLAADLALLSWLAGDPQAFASVPPADTVPAAGDKGAADAH